jgi:hypothetical protein
MITKTQADQLIAMLKEAARNDPFIWRENLRQDEIVLSVGDPKLKFVLTLKRNLHEIKLHIRTQDRNIGLARIDNAPYHCNPDGSEIRNQPHLHLYREGHEMAWAEPITWYDLSRPLDTLEKFLNIINTRFRAGYSVPLI